MFCCHHQILPPLFFNLFLFNKQVHNYYTRSSDDYRSHNYRTNTKFTVLFQGLSLWNSLPTYIINSETQFCFRKRLKLSIEPLLTFVKINYPILPIISLLYLRRTTMRRPPSYKPHGFWGPLRHSFLFNFPTIKLPIETFKQINYIISL